MESRGVRACRSGRFALSWLLVCVLLLVAVPVAKRDRYDRFPGPNCYSIVGLVSDPPGAYSTSMRILASKPASLFRKVGGQFGWGFFHTLRCFPCCLLGLVLVLLERKARSPLLLCVIAVLLGLAACSYSAFAWFTQPGVFGFVSEKLPGFWVLLAWGLALPVGYVFCWLASMRQKGTSTLGDGPIPSCDDSCYAAGVAEPGPVLSGEAKLSPAHSRVRVLVVAIAMVPLLLAYVGAPHLRAFRFARALRSCDVDTLGAMLDDDWTVEIRDGSDLRFEMKEGPGGAYFSRGQLEDMMVECPGFWGVLYGYARIQHPRALGSAYRGLYVYGPPFIVPVFGGVRK